ncbi:hypothetical protein KAH37_03695 [bacterium]|nr:hypothetical protein [bacterium]
MIKKRLFFTFIFLFFLSLGAELKNQSYHFSDNYHLFLVADSAKAISFSSYRLTAPDRVIVEIQGEVLTQKLIAPTGPVTKVEVKDGGETLRLIFYIKEHSFYSILNRNNSILISFAAIPLEDENDLTQAIALLNVKKAEQRQQRIAKKAPPAVENDAHAEEKMIAQLALSLKQQEEAEKERLRLAKIAKIEAEKEQQRQIALLKKKQDDERKRQAEIARIEAEKEQKRLAEIARIKAEKERLRLAEIARVEAEKERLRLAEIARIKVEKEKERQIALLKQKQEAERKRRELALKKVEEERLRLAALEKARIEKERLRQEALLRKRQEEERKKQELALKKAEEERQRKVEQARIKAKAEHDEKLALLKKKKEEEKRNRELALLKKKKEEEERNRKPVRKKLLKTADGTTVALKVSSPHSDRSLDGETPMLAVTPVRKAGVLNNLYFRKYPRFSRITMELTGDVDYQLKEIKGGFVINIYNFKVIPKRLLNIIDTRYFNSVITYIYPKKADDVFKIYVKTGKGTAVRQSKEGLMVNFDFYTPTIK